MPRANAVAARSRSGRRFQPARRSRLGAPQDVRFARAARRARLRCTVVRFAMKATTRRARTPRWRRGAVVPPIWRRRRQRDGETRWPPREPSRPVRDAPGRSSSSRRLYPESCRTFALEVSLGSRCRRLSNVLGLSRKQPTERSEGGWSSVCSPVLTSIHARGFAVASSARAFISAKPRRFKPRQRSGRLAWRSFSARPMPQIRSWGLASTRTRGEVPSR